MGESLGLDARAEYPVPGGRIDVVWMWPGHPKFDRTLPLVGFEIESSWRTRKHIKGDLMNLMDLQPSLGVILLAGQGAEVESTKAFARTLVERRATRIEIWDEDDLQIPQSARTTKPPIAVSRPSGAAMESGSGARGKYSALYEWLGHIDRDSLAVRFGEIEEVLGFPLPASSRTHRAHWSGYEGSAVARAIRDAGWRANKVNLETERLVLERVR